MRPRPTFFLPMLLLASLLFAAPLVNAGPTFGHGPLARHEVRQAFAGATTVYALASLGRQVLLVNTLLNSSSDLVLFDPARNSSSVVQAIAPGGSSTYLSGVAAAGGAFFTGWYNFSTGTESFEKVTTSGAVRPISLPLGTNQAWNFVYGNHSALFATAGPYLDVIDPTTLTLVHNYSAVLPTGVYISSVLPVGARIYLAGSQPAAHGTTSAFFGFYNQTNRHFRAVTPSGVPNPAGLSGEFFTLLGTPSGVYVGGVMVASSTTSFGFSTAVGLFDRFSPTTGKFTNLSADLPNATWGVVGLEPWGSSVALSLSAYASTVTGLFTVGGLFTYSPGRASLVNLTSEWGPGYVPDVLEVTTESGGYLTSGGGNSLNGLAEVVSVHR